jgi:hypothetical protein
MRRLLIVVLSATLLLAACSGKDKKEVSASGKGTTTTSEVSTSSTEVDAGASTTVAGGAKTGTTKKPAAKPGAASGGASTAGPQQATPAGVKAAAPGKYTYKITGTQQLLTPTPQPVNDTSTLTVDALQGTDQHTTDQGPNSGTEQVLRYQPDGVYLVDLKLTGPINKEFKPEPPGLVFPQPATIGKTWSWNATSTDGKTTVKSEFKIARTETIAVGGEQVPCVVLEATVTTGGDIVSTSKRTIWTSEAYKLVVRQDDKSNGTYSGYSFKFDTSSVLQSTKPA